MLPGLVGTGFFGSSAPSGPSATLWRVNVTATQSSGFVIAREIEMRETSGGADQCSGGTANASSANGGTVAANAFDNNTTTYWQATSSGAWISYQFGSSKSITEISWQIHNATGDGIKNFSIDYWNGSAWVTSWSVTGATWSSSSQIQIFTKP